MLKCRWRLTSNIHAVFVITNIDGVHGDNDIVSMWKQHYAAIFNRIFNSVEKSSCDQAHSDFCNTNIAFDSGMTADRLR